MEKNIKGLILAVIGDIQEEKESARMEPTHAMAIKDSLVWRIGDRSVSYLGESIGCVEIMQELTHLILDGSIESGRTINDTYYRLPMVEVADIIANQQV